MNPTYNLPIWSTYLKADSQIQMRPIVPVRRSMHLLFHSPCNCRSMCISRWTYYGTSTLGDVRWLMGVVGCLGFENTVGEKVAQRLSCKPQASKQLLNLCGWHIHGCCILALAPSIEMK